MTVLSRYLLRQFRRFFALALGAFLMIYLLIDVIDRIRTLITYRAAVPDAIAFFLFKIPMFFYQVCPVAACIAIILTLGMMARNRETIALAAGGIAPGALVAPLLFASVVVTGAVLVSNEWIMPPSIAASERIWNLKIKKIPGKVRYRTHEIWFRGGGNSVWHVRFLGPEENALTGVTIFWFLEGETEPLRRVDARQATWDEGRGGWLFSGATDWRFREGNVVSSKSHDGLLLKLPETPEDFKVMERHQDEMNVRTLSRQIDELTAMGYKTVKLRVQRSVKTAIPFTSVVIGMLAIALGLRARRVSLGGALALTVIIAVAYWGMLAVAMALGNSGVLAPWIAGWVTTVAFAAGGIVALTASLES